MLCISASLGGLSDNAHARHLFAPESQRAHDAAATNPCVLQTVGALGHRDKCRKAIRPNRVGISLPTAEDLPGSDAVPDWGSSEQPARQTAAPAAPSHLPSLGVMRVGTVLLLN